MGEQFVTVREWRERLEKTRVRLMSERKRIWPEGSTRQCSMCGDGRLRGRSDMVREVEAGDAILVFSNLHGAVCDDCESECLEPYDQVAIEQRDRSTFRAPIEGSITMLGGRKLGTYWPRDVANALDLKPQDRLRITPLSHDTMVVRVVHDHE